jgi:glycopeptide antibiotics resistance protein
MKKRLLPAIILIAYSAILIKVMVFKDMPLIRIGPLMLNFGGTQEGPANLIPFKTIFPYLLGEKGLMIAIINIAGNIALLVPIGFLIPFIFQNITWKKTIVIAIAAGFTIEGMQVLLHVGIFDIDDVILNALGVMIGYWAFVILTNWMHSGKYKTIIITASIIIVVVVAAIYAIYPKGQQLVNSRIDTASVQPDLFDTGTIKSDSFYNGDGKISQGVDPCNGTGGTGQIVSLGNNTITIKRNDGINEIINLTDKTTIKNSLGTLSQSDLKTGDRVTVVVMADHIATAVLVCNTQHAGSGK